MDEHEAVAQIVQIQNLLARFAQAADLGTLEEYGSLITPDFVWEFPGNPVSSLEPQIVRGRDAVLGAAQERRDRGIQGPGTHTRHVVTSVSVQPDPVAPTSVAYLSYYLNTDQTPVLTSTNVYHDTFARSPDGGWLLSHRVISYP